MEPLFLIHRVLGSLLLASVLMPLIPSAHWTVRVFDYPRNQKLVLLLACIALGCALWRHGSLFDRTLLVALMAATVYVVWLVWPYSPLGRKMVQQAAARSNDEVLKLLVCNVYQHNRRYDRMAALIKAKDPDIVFLLETDSAWQKAIVPAVDQLKYRIEVPLDNTYGLLFYARFPLKDEQVRYLIDTEIPSIVTDITLHDRLIRFYGLHPTPPVPQENPESTERDAEVLIIGREAKACPHPVIVFGDLNDVAWSHTTRLFLRISGLLDPRRGRGMFSTFHARYPFLRWPLDHFFVSGHFRLVDMRVERNVGSDHFPISLSVVLRGEDDSEALEADHADRMEAAEKIAEGKESGAKAVGR